MLEFSLLQIYYSGTCISQVQHFPLLFRDKYIESNTINNQRLLIHILLDTIENKDIKAEKRDYTAENRDDTIENKEITFSKRKKIQP